MSSSLPDPPLAYPIQAPDGRAITIPSLYDPAAERFPAPIDEEAFRAHYRQEGYVVVRNLVAPSLCERLREAYAAEVKPTRDYFIRHEDGRPARHVFTEAGFMKHPIANVQDLPQRRYPEFRTAALDLITEPGLQRAVRVLLGDPGQLIHTLFTEGNQQTWAHRDGDYIDSERHGTMLGVWIALEEIHPGAGRFYVYPRSHTLRLAPTGDEARPNHPAHKAYMVRLLREHGWGLYAPALRAGDAILWNADLIHGALETREPQRSRLALTGHFIARADRPVWFHGAPIALEQTIHRGMPVCFHYDRNRWPRDWIYAFEARFPQPALRLRRLYRRLR